MKYENVTKEIYELKTNKDGAPLFSQDNFKLINTFLRYDSNYNGVEDATNLVFAKTYGGILTREKENFFNFKKIEDYVSEEEYMKNDSLYLVIESIDKMNSTHLASEGPKGGNKGRIKTAQGVYDIKNFRERLFNADAKLVDEISCFGGKNNFSFASKFCSYLCRYLFKDLPQENNYCIYDEVVQSVLPYFANYYKVDLDKKYYVTYIRNGIKHNHSTVCSVKTCGGYSEYIKLINAIVEKIKQESNIDVTYEAFDHMLWYFFKGQPNKIQELMDKLPKLK